MAYYAKLKNDIVQTVIVVSDTIDDGASWCVENYGGEWVECTDGGVGWTHSNGVFTAPKPYPSWTLDANNNWQPPVPYPSDGEAYRWSEEDQEWVAI